MENILMKSPIHTPFELRASNVKISQTKKVKASFNRFDGDDLTNWNPFINADP